MATNPDFGQLHIGMAHLRRRHSVRVDTGLRKADIAEMEAKLASLNTHMEHLRSSVDRLADVPERLAKVETKIDALPSKDYLSGKLTAMLRNVGILTGIIVGLATLAIKFLP